MRRGFLVRLGCRLLLFAAVPALAQPAPTIPEPAAVFDSAVLPTAGEHASLLRVMRPGRFAITAASPTGTALELVDMLTGPSEISGAAGASDGRIDRLLDLGTYKLRLYGAAGAAGETRLSIVRFRDRGGPLPAPDGGAVVTAALADLEQQSFRLDVAAPGPLRIEAAGRGLRDLRLWRDGRDLVPLDPVARNVEPSRGHPLNDLVLEGAVEAGTYLVTAYGGPALPWADGSAAQPLYLRVGGAPELVEGWVRGKIGPLGSEVYEIGPAETAFRLDLDAAAPVALRVGETGRVLAATAITADSRSPHATLSLAAGSGGRRWVEIAGAAGQKFALRGFWWSGARSLATAGDWWLGAASLGFGGDELPATALLLRLDAKGGGVPVASNAPAIGPDRAWRGRFNLRGPSSLLFEVTSPGPIAVHGEGFAASAAIESLGGSNSGAGAAPSQWDLAAGWYRLRLKPKPGAAGPIDVTLGPPGLSPERPAAPQPADPGLSFGRQTLAAGQQLSLMSGDAPGAMVELSARALPADLAKLPVSVTLPAGEGLQLPVRPPAGGRLFATAIGEGPVAIELRDAQGEGEKRVAILEVAAVADRARSLVFGWHPPAAPASPPPAATMPQAASLATGRPLFFDLARDERRSFMLTVEKGGLYRIETLGRLATEGWIGSAFLAEIDHQAANGHGRNMLLQSWLRAGRYRVSVAARDSAGHLGLAAQPAPLLAGGTLLPGGGVRASLPAGSGAVLPIEIARQGSYHFDLVGLRGNFTARLEDAEGWPILPAGDLSSLDRALSPGRYRLLVLPPEVDARLVARLTRVEKTVELSGHGPHQLAFEVPQHYQWREPVGRDARRLPDEWVFALAGPAHVSLDISDGMVAELRRADASGGPPLARLVYQSGFEGELAAGNYRVDAASLGRNDRLDYTLSLKSAELQPGRPRRVTLPASVPFAIAHDRIVSLTSFGRVAVEAVLRDAAGRVVGRWGHRTDDWNIAVSRRLVAGRYALDLKATAPPPAVPTAQPGDADPDKPAEPDAQKQQPETELRLALPQAADTVAAPAAGAVSLAGADVHLVALPSPPGGTLLLAGAASSAELVLALESQASNGDWREVALDQGRTPIVAIPADGDMARPWRAALWTVDGGPEPVRFATRVFAATPQAIGTIQWAPAGLEGVAGELRAARVAVPGATLLRFAGEARGILAGSAPGGALRPVEGRIVAPQSERLWLLARDGAVAPPTLAALVPKAAEEIALDLPAGGTAIVPAGPDDDRGLRLWLAQSGFGQPGIAAGRGMGVAPGSAVALAGAAALKVWNAGDSDALRLRLEPVDLRLLPERSAEAALLVTVPARSALPLRLPHSAAGTRLRLDLPAGAAAIAGWRAADAVTAWSGAASSSWLIEGGWDDALLVNSSPLPLPARLSVAPLPEAPAVLRPGTAAKRFFGGAGTYSLPFEARPGQRLVTAGAAATVIAADGRVRRGAVIPVEGSGRLVLRHPAGLVAAWIEGDGVSPWPAAPPRAVRLPAELALAGLALSVSFAVPVPTLIEARTTTPVIAILVDGGHEAAPILFPAGAELHRYLPPGAAELRLVSPQDGPLTGSLELAATPVVPAGEGLGEAVAVAPGGTALFAFETLADGPVGVGVRADPDRAAVRLLDENGTVLGSGVAMLRRLAPGHYLIEARLPPDAATALVRPAVVGIARHPSGPPAEVARHYLELVGMLPAAAR